MEKYRYFFGEIQTHFWRNTDTFLETTQGPAVDVLARLQLVTQAVPRHRIGHRHYIKTDDAKQEKKYKYIKIQIQIHTNTNTYKTSFNVDSLVISYRVVFLT